jgi:transposase
MPSILPMTKKRNKSKVKRYSTDLNEKKWAIINPLLPDALSGGRPREVSLRKVINTIFYMSRA